MALLTPMKFEPDPTNRFPDVLTCPLISREYAVFGVLLILIVWDPLPSLTFPFKETSLVEPFCK